jgi:hypothetical protein
MEKDIKHFFMHLLAICISFENCPLSSFAHLFGGLLLGFLGGFAVFLALCVF